MPSNLLDFRLKIVGEDKPEKPKLSFRLSTWMATKVNFRLKSGGGNHSEKPKLSFQLAAAIPAKVDF